MIVHEYYFATISHIDLYFCKNNSFKLFIYIEKKISFAYLNWYHPRPKKLSFEQFETNIDKKPLKKGNFLKLKLTRYFSINLLDKVYVIYNFMLLSNQKRLKIQDIIKRISLDKEVSLKERIYVEKYAKHNSPISLWLKKAKSIRRHGLKSEGSIDSLLQSLGIDGLDKDNHFKPNKDDISDWFGGSPDWIKRS